MASIDAEHPGAPPADKLGLALFVCHLAVGAYLVLGWIVPDRDALVFYAVLVPLVAGQWHLNHGSCIINNIESWLRSGRWRDPSNVHEGRFLQMLCLWLFGIRPSARRIEAASYGALLVLWFLALGHLAEFAGSGALLAVFATSLG